MQYLFDAWVKIKKELTRKAILLFLDYDGTLTPIINNPSRAVLSQGVRGILKRLVASPRYKLAVISGRALADLKKMVAIPGIIYVGNHGLEIEGPKIKFVSPVSLRYRRMLQSIKEDLISRLSAVKGALVEDKGLSLSIHYRQVDKQRLPELRAILREATILYTVRDKIRVQAGKKVFEIRPAVNWDKGRIVLWLLARWKFGLGDSGAMPIYLGDDTTDEDAFRALSGRGISIFVGRPKGSLARYYLKNTKEVTDFLKGLLGLPEE